LTDQTLIFRRVMAYGSKPAKKVKKKPKKKGMKY